MQWEQISSRAQKDTCCREKKHSVLTQSQRCHRRCRAFCINREQQIPALRMLHAPFIKMASLLPCKRTNGMGGSAVPDGVVSRAPGTAQTGCLRGLLGLLLCVVGALEHEAVPIYFGSGRIDGGKCASGSVWDVLELLCPPRGQRASTEVRANFTLAALGWLLPRGRNPSLSSPKT